METINRAAFATSLILAVLLASCGDSTGPSVLDLRGDWSYSVTGLQGGGLQCEVLGVALTIRQDGGDLSGESTAGTLSCTGEGDLFAVGLEAADISGTATRNSAGFQIGDDRWRHSASFGGDVMTGSVTLTRTIGGEEVTLNGTFTARRES